MLTSTGLVSSMTPSVQVWWQCRTTRWLQRNLFSHVNQVSCSHAVQLGQDRTEMLLNGQHDRLLPKASSKILPEPTDLVQPLFLTGPQLMRALGFVAGSVRLQPLSVGLEAVALAIQLNTRPRAIAAPLRPMASRGQGVGAIAPTTIPQATPHTHAPAVRAS